MQPEFQPFWTPETYSATIVPPSIGEAYCNVLPYLNECLVSVHPYRKGAVCPFMPVALRKGTVYFTYFVGSDDKYATNFIKRCCEFLEQANRGKSFGALTILFPKEFEIERLLELQIHNKIQCVSRLFMIGALYKDNTSASLHNKDYFPLRTPTPTLVIRDLAVLDLIFLDPKHYNIKARLIFLNSFISKFSRGDSRTSEMEQVQEAVRLKEVYENQLHRQFWVKVAVVVVLTVVTLFLFREVFS